MFYIGPTNGLSFVLNAETYDYIKNSKGGLGIKVSANGRFVVKYFVVVPRHNLNVVPWLYSSQQNNFASFIHVNVQSFVVSGTSMPILRTTLGASSVAISSNF